MDAEVIRYWFSEKDFLNGCEKQMTRWRNQPEN